MAGDPAAGARRRRGRGGRRLARHAGARAGHGGLDRRRPRPRPHHRQPRRPRLCAPHRNSPDRRPAAGRDARRHLLPDRRPAADPRRGRRHGAGGRLGRLVVLAPATRPPGVHRPEGELIHAAAHTHHALPVGGLPAGHRQPRRGRLRPLAVRAGAPGAHRHRWPAVALGKPRRRGGERPAHPGRRHRLRACRFRRPEPRGHRQRRRQRRRPAPVPGGGRHPGDHPKRPAALLQRRADRRALAPRRAGDPHHPGQPQPARRPAPGRPRPLCRGLGGSGVPPAAGGGDRGGGQRRRPRPRPLYQHHRRAELPGVPARAAGGRDRPASVARGRSAGPAAHRRCPGRARRRPAAAGHRRPGSRHGRRHHRHAGDTPRFHRDPEDRPESRAQRPDRGGELHHPGDHRAVLLHATRLQAAGARHLGARRAVQGQRPRNARQDRQRRDPQDLPGGVGVSAQHHRPAGAAAAGRAPAAAPGARHPAPARTPRRNPGGRRTRRDHRRPAGGGAAQAGSDADQRKADRRRSAQRAVHRPAAHVGADLRPAHAPDRPGQGAPGSHHHPRPAGRPGAGT